MSGLAQNDLKSGENSSGQAPAGICPIKKFYIEKTAELVAKRGLEFEKSTMTNCEESPRFSFLWSSDPYHEYYKYKVSEAQNHLDAPSDPQANQGDDAPSDAQAQLRDRPFEPNFPMFSNFPKFPVRKEPDPRLAEWNACEDLPPEPPYIIDLPREKITRKELYTIKLTAQLVARHGMDLIKSRNMDSRFEFMNPTDSNFDYFHRLVAAYSEEDSNAPIACCTATVLEVFFRRLQRDPLQEMETQKKGVLKFQEWLHKYGGGAKPSEAALVDKHEFELMCELGFFPKPRILPEEPEPERHKPALVPQDQFLAQHPVMFSS